MCSVLSLLMVDASWSHVAGAARPESCAVIYLILITMDEVGWFAFYFTYWPPHRE